MSAHGTLRRRQAGCHCIDCRCAANESYAHCRGMEPRGILVTLNLPVVESLIGSHGLTSTDLALIMGIHRRMVEQWLTRGRLTIYNADKLAVALGTHYSLIVTDDVVSIPEHHTLRKRCV